MVAASPRNGAVAGLNAFLAGSLVSSASSTLRSFHLLARRFTHFFGSPAELDRSNLPLANGLHAGPLAGSFLSSAHQRVP
jgi:hypothetical protein